LIPAGAENDSKTALNSQKTGNHTEHEKEVKWIKTGG
jgi:hypothetical protein